jgi:uncharacterized OB-fold protein
MPDAALEAKFKDYVGKAVGPAEVGRDVVNEPMIRHWCEAMGDDNPAYTDSEAAGKSVHGGIVAPPTMMQAWILKGYEMALDTEPEDLQEELHAIFNEHGYSGVVATNCDQGYTRYLRPGDRVSAVMTIESISEEKATAVGIGYFIETKTTFLDQNDEEIGWMTFRVLKFKPQEGQEAAAPGDDGGAPAPPGRIRPPLSQDVAWWWNDGIQQGRLLIQKCSACGVLRHPPRPSCGECQSMEWEHVESSGKGVVHSYVIMHHPPLPGYEMPMAVGLIDLEEGTRLVAGIEGGPLDAVEIGMHVQCTIEELDASGFKGPVFRPVA